jgi:hypothetical protein
MGCWIMRNVTFGSKVAKAQQDFVNSTDNAVLVQTDDLSCLIHYDNASQLIIGYRIAEALKLFLMFVPVFSQTPHRPSTLPCASRLPVPCTSLRKVK